MTGDQVSKMAAAMAMYLRELALIPFVPGGAALVAGAAALESLAANAAECAALASAATVGVTALQIVWEWLKSRGQTDAARALMSTTSGPE